MPLLQRSEVEWTLMCKPSCVNSPCVHSLPLQDLMPGLLIVLVVDFNNVGHVVGSEVVVTPAPSAGQSKNNETKWKKKTFSAQPGNGCFRFLTLH